ncbi:MAG: glycosyltransferase [Desulfacinum sp.]|nr:glycosyltransferase [Desulfacinum sp.]
MYRHVDILNDAGIEAYIIHKRKGFRCTWFENCTPIVYWQDSTAERLWEKVRKRINPGSIQRMRVVGGSRREIGSRDILVIPEIYGPGIAHLGRGTKKIILNQNCHLTFRGYNFQSDSPQNAYGHPDVVGVLVNIRDTAEYLNYVFPSVRVEEFRLSIDKGLFHYERQKKSKSPFRSSKTSRMPSR